MGTSTDAVLAYGWAWDEEFDADNVLSEEDSLSDHDHTDPMSRWEELENALCKLGLELDCHCSYDAVMPALVVRASRVVAYRGMPVALTAHPQPIAREWNENLAKGLALLKEACKGLEFPPEFLQSETPPSWVLYSWWG